MRLGPEGWTEEAARLYISERCDGVWLNSDRPVADLEFLRPLPNLRAMVFGAAVVKDASALFDKMDLEELGVGLNVRDLRGLSRLRQLRVLAVPFRKGAAEIADLDRLEMLAVEEWPKGAELDLLGHKPRLRDLYLQLKRTAVVSSSWFPSAPALRHLSLYFGRLSDTVGLAALTEMEELRFANTKVNDLSFVSAMPRLRCLELDNAGEITSLRPLRGHPALTELYVIGKTTIIDGDLDIRADVPNLRTGSIADRPF